MIRKVLLTVVSEDGGSKEDYVNKYPYIKKEGIYSYDKEGREKLK